ncbi:MAG: CHAT domain-containing protein, partial [Bacteroidetes bacterium]|nr:CHAT domain-containing protein [Bacteroidota bacterium]
AGAGDLLNKTSFNYNIESGILTAYEAMNLNFDYTDLVVLSACETGLGDVQIGEGVYGLQRAFLVAGAKVLIMSLFKVSDEATQKLMVKFYQGWLETGEMRNSFLEAKKEVRNEYKYPIFWASFIMIGMEE